MLNKFKNYFERRLLLESVYEELKGELENDTYHSFIGTPPNKALTRMLTSPSEDKKTFAAKLLFQIYIAALVLGISEVEIKTDPNILLKSDIKNNLDKVFGYYDKDRSITFSDEFRHLTRNFTPKDYLDIESPKSQSVVEKLTNEFGDIEFITKNNDKVNQSVNTDI